jgi:endo-1,4-beta-D-glucanase Y
MDDKETFDQTLSWANDNLKRPNDSLYSWLFGKRPDGSYGVMIEQGGRNTASDADTDVALALVFASERFGDSSYLVLAKNMIGDIWDHEVVTIRGVPYLAANDLEKDAQGRIIINPSYFAPYAYKIFATVDSSHPWTALVDSSYALLTKATTANLDTGSTAGLPPDWITLSKKTGNIIPNESPHITTNFSYDALRVLWRVGLDYAWFKEPRAKEYLSQVTFLDNTWKSTNNLDAIYSHDGKSIIAHEAPALYGASLGYFMVYDKKTADDIYHHKLLALYNPDISAWKKPLSYYDDNWAWFGMALYKNFLPNLAIQ